MIDRLILSAVLGAVGWHGLNPEPPVPLTLKQKAKERSMSAVCDKKKKTKTVKQMCERWKEQQNA
tara:strand:+ start:174 stop:368 length:195 start_codon:yes stop_codon:yes gene_type:complete